jgi:hypothetical protein
LFTVTVTLPSVFPFFVTTCELVEDDERVGFGFSELSCAVAEKVTARARHAMGRCLVFMIWIF